MAAMKINNASKVPDRFSTLPWPKGWLSSAGLPETLTATKAMMAASRSTDEWAASEMMETDPIHSPTKSFKIISRVLDATDKRAALDFRRSS